MPHKSHYKVEGLLKRYQHALENDFKTRITAVQPIKTLNSYSYLLYDGKL